MVQERVVPTVYSLRVLEECFDSSIRLAFIALGAGDKINDFWERAPREARDYLGCLTATKWVSMTHQKKEEKNGHDLRGYPA